MPKVVDHEQRRRELVDASWDVIVDSGIEGLSLRNVAKAAGCTTGRISHYFSNRESLLSAALTAVHQNAGDRMAVIARSKESSTDQLKLIAREALPLDKKRLREWMVWIVFWAAAASNPELAKLNRQRYVEWRRLLHQLLAGLSSQHEVNAKVEEFVALIDGLGLRITLDSTRENRLLAETTIDRWVDSLG